MFVEILRTFGLVKEEGMKKLYRKLFILMTVLVSALLPRMSGAEEVTPVRVTQTKGSVSGTYFLRDVLRTSAGRLYYIVGNKNVPASGWLEMFSSVNGDAWGNMGTIYEWLDTADISVAIDSKNIIHIITYDWNKRPYYLKFNTLDSPGGDNSWEGFEVIDSRASTTSLYNSALAVDGNDTPHIVYRLYESYKGKSYSTLYYTNKTGGVWNKKALWPKEKKASFAGNFDIAIGPDNVPYILMGNKVLRGNANNPASFEEKDLGPVTGYSFVIHQNGDIRVALSNNGNYAHFVHDHTQPWSSGWTLYDSGNPLKGSLLAMLDEAPCLVYLENGGLWMQKNFDAPVLLGTQPTDTIWTALFTKWHFYNNHFPGIIDLGVKTADSFWYGKVRNSLQASFSPSPATGIPPLTIGFTENSIVPEGRAVISWQWDFENDGVIDSTAQSPSFIYTDAGKYTVRLTVTDFLGGTNTRIYTGCVEVRGIQDADRDGVVDTEDNCPLVFNPAQTDLDTDGIGDECDGLIDLSFRSLYSTGLKSSFSDEKNPQDITTYMEDTLTDHAFLVQRTPRTSDVISFGINVEANTLAGAVLYVYVNEIFGTQLPPVTVSNYNADGVSVETYLGLNGSIHTGWNYIDVTPLLSQMGGFGFVKFRLSTSGSGFTVSEAYFIVNTDNLEIRTDPPELDFGPAETGDVLISNLTVWNSGPPTLVIQELFPPSGPFSVQSDGCSGRTISEPCSIIVKFAPVTPGLFYDTLTILSNDADTPNMKVSLAGTAQAPSNTVTGTVTDSLTGLPLSGVTGTLSDIFGLHTAVTDSLGAYTITGLAKGTYTAIFAKPGYVEKTLNGIIEAGRNIVNAGLSPVVAALTGAVSDGSTGLPLAGVTVTVTDAAARTFSTTSDANGGYMFPGLSPGTFAASFEKPGYVKGTASGTLEFGESHVLNISLAPLPPLVATIISPPDGAVVNSSWLTVSGLVTNNADVSVNGTSAAVTDNAFSAIIPLKEGVNTVTAAATDAYGQTASHSITVTLTGLIDKEEIFVTPLSLDFGTVTVGGIKSMELTVTNTGTANLSINQISASPPFMLSDVDECSWQVLTASSSCSVGIKFVPVLEGDFSGTLQIPSGDADRPLVTIALNGTGNLTDSGYLLPDTGQRDCFSSLGDVIACSPSLGQDGSYIINPLSYTEENSLTIIDKNTGLIWQREDDGTAKSWTNAVNYCKSLDLDGYGDWRLPTYFELLTIVDYGRSNPSIDPLIFVNTNSSFYWTSSTEVGGAKAISFDNGISSTLLQSSANSVRCVRGSELPEGFLSDNYDGTLTDWDPGLMWTKDYYSSRTWNQALYLCNVMEVGGYTDWRLPDIKELLSKTYTDCYLGDCFSWSSTTFGQPDATGDYKQALVYDNIDIAPHDKSSTHMLRCVRSGWGTLKANITGIVLDAWNSSPVSSATVSVTDAQLKTLAATTDENGKYTITGVAPGVFIGTITKTGYNPYSFTETVSPGQVLTHDAQLVSLPRPPVIDNINVSALTTDSAIITWTMDQPSTVLFEYGTTASYGSSYSDPTLTTEYTITLTGLAPSTTYHFRITATNGGGLSSSTGDNTFTTLTPPVQITITPSSPASGATITRPDIMVTGTIINNTGNETGVTVNGIVAALYGNQFVVNHVPLVDGENTITITATDAAGNTETTSITVYAVTTGAYISLNSNIESGIAPLEAVLRVDGTFSIEESTISVTGPGDVELIQSSADEYTVRVTVEGIYYFATNVIGSDGLTYRDTIGIVVFNKTQLDNLLKGKWEEMKGNLINGNITNAITYMTAETKLAYEEMFSELIESLPSIMAAEREFNMLSIKNGVCRYELVTLENGTIYSYEAIFRQSKNGLWMIKEF